MVNLNKENNLRVANLVARVGKVGYWTPILVAPLVKEDMTALRQQRCDLILNIGKAETAWWDT